MTEQAVPGGSQVDAEDLKPDLTDEQQADEQQFNDPELREAEDSEESEEGQV